MTTKNKKETIIIVILILLILAFLIPSIKNLEESKNLKADTLLVKRLNEALEIDKKAGKTHPTMHDALTALQGYGFVIERINVSSNENEILWDSDNDLFCYLDAKNDEIIYIPEFTPKTSPCDVAYFKIYQLNEVNPVKGVVDFTGTNSRFSAYIVRNDKIKYVYTDKGFDAGRNQCVRNVYYANANAQSVIVRTNGGALSIDGKDDVIRHYGKANSVNITNIAMSSYEEYGNVYFISIKEGHIVVTKSCSVSAIHFIKSGKKDNTGADLFSEMVVTVDEGANLPDFSRDGVKINQEIGTKVCKVELSEEEQYIYLFQYGIFEQIKVAHENEQEQLVWIDVSDASTDAQTVAHQLANLYEGDVAWVNDDDTERELILKPGEKVEETGLEALVREKEVNASIKVQALIDGIEDTPTVYDVYDLSIFFDRAMGKNSMYTDTAKLDKAFIFAAMSEDDFDALEIFLQSKNSDGTYIFNKLADYNQENFDKALLYLENNGYQEESETMSLILSDKADYLDWSVDFEVSFDKDVDAGTVILAGAYDNYKDDLWTGFGLPYQLKAGESVKLMETALGIFNNKDGEWSQDYLQILSYVREFKCGFANMHKDNIGTNITVKLCIYSPDKTQRIECGTYEYTLGEISEENQGYISNMK